MDARPFVAREGELAQLGQFLDRSLDGLGHVCFVTGEAGSGKTALVTEFARRAQEAHRDLVIAVGVDASEETSELRGCFVLADFPVTVLVSSLDPLDQVGRTLNATSGRLASANGHWSIA